LCSGYNFRPKEIMRQELIRQVVVFVAVTVAASFVFIQSSAAASRVLSEKLVSLVAPVGVLLCLFLLTRWMLAREGRSPRDLGLDLTLRRAKEWLAGGSWVASPSWRPGVSSFGSALHFTGSRILNSKSVPWRPASLPASNTREELFFRGYVFDRLIKTLGAWWAQTIVAAPFAAWHIWQGVPWIAAMTATTVASFLFGSVVLRWRSIAAAAGLHAAANFVRDMVLPLSISQQRRSQLYRTAIYHFNDECCCSSL
jgi:membrane protease YdiL (CAAX protease family)